MNIFSPDGTANSRQALSCISLTAEHRNGDLDTAAALLVDDPKAHFKAWTPADDDQGLNNAYESHWYWRTHTHGAQKLQGHKNRPGMEGRHRSALEL